MNQNELIEKWQYLSLEKLSLTQIVADFFRIRNYNYASFQPFSGSSRNGRRNRSAST